MRPLIQGPIFLAVACMVASITAATERRPQAAAPDAFAYTPEEAARGRQVYETYCAMCHGATMDGNGEDAPALVSARFDSHWRNRPPSALFEKVRRSMPADDPGSLTIAQAKQATAAILQANGMTSPAGDRSPRKN